MTEPYSPSKSDQQFSEVVQLKAEVKHMDERIDDIWDAVKDLRSRKFPWLALAGIIVPIVSAFGYFSLQNILVINLTAERIVAIQKDMGENANNSQKAYDLHTAELKELRGRLDLVEKQKTGK